VPVAAGEEMLLLLPLLSAAQSQDSPVRAQGLQQGGGTQPPRLPCDPGTGQQRSCCHSKAHLAMLGCSQLLLKKA